jgi:small subunit ribosomal protein S15
LTTNGGQICGTNIPDDFLSVFGCVIIIPYLRKESRERQESQLEKERKQELIGQFARKKNDTGSAEVQVALLTERINSLTDHLNANHHDHDTRRGLLRLVVQRRRLLSYLSRIDADRYNQLIKTLGLRK